MASAYSKSTCALPHPMKQRHEDLPLHPQQLVHRFLHLRVLSPVAHLPDAFVDPLSGVALFLRVSSYPLSLPPVVARPPFHICVHSSRLLRHGQSQSLSEGGYLRVSHFSTIPYPQGFESAFINPGKKKLNVETWAF